MTLSFFPPRLLSIGRLSANPVPFSRSGGRSLSGIEPTIRTDAGYWSIAFGDIIVGEIAQRRLWNSLRTDLAGRAGLLVLPIYSADSAPTATATTNETFFDDGTGFTDNTGFHDRLIQIDMAVEAAIGATQVRLRLVSGEEALSGIRFSYQHAMYETGKIVEQIDDDEWVVSVFPAIRKTIPAGARLECDLPTCLVRLAEDRGMDIDLTLGHFDRPTVRFVEAVDYWSQLAAGLI